MSSSPEQLTKFLGPGPYPVSLESPGFDSLFSFHQGSSVSVIQPKDTEVVHDPSHSHRHDSYEFTIPKSGSPLLRLESAEITLSDGMLLPCNPGRLHGPGEPMERADFTAIQIRKEFIQGLSRAIFGRKALLFREEPIVPPDSLFHLLDRFIAEASSSLPGRELVLDTLEVQIAVDVLREIPNTATGGATRRGSSSAVGIIRAIERMRAHFTDEFDADELARQADMSRHHFFRAFKGYAGTTPRGFLMQLRLQKALDLLPMMEYSVTEVCYLCGFSNHSHFSSSFRQRFGMTPSAFRRRSHRSSKGD